MSVTVYGIEPKLFVGEIPDEYICPLCFNILCNPKSCPNGHNFCGSCITEAVNRLPECPICKTDANINRFCRSLFLENILRKLKMVCISCEDQQIGEIKCSWTGTIDFRQSHYEDECRFFKFKCPNLECSEYVQRQNLISHLTIQCSFRHIKCGDCQSTLLVNSLKTHMLQCSHRMIDCPNQCGLRSTFAQITTHCDTDCPLQNVKCPLFELGLCHEKCKGSYTRSSIMQHTSTQSDKLRSQQDLISKLESETCTLAESKELFRKEAELRIYELSHQLKLSVAENKNRVGTSEVEKTTIEMNMDECIEEQAIEKLSIGQSLVADVLAQQGPVGPKTSADLAHMADLVDSHLLVSPTTELEAKQTHAKQTSRVVETSPIINVIRKKYIAVNWQHVENIVARELVPHLSVDIRTNTAEKIIDKGISASLLWHCLLLMNGNAKLGLNDLQQIVMTCITDMFAKLTSRSNCSTEPIADHRQLAVGRVVQPYISGDVTFILCIVHLEPEWKSYETLRKHIQWETIEAQPMMDLYDLILHGVMNLLQLSVENDYQKICTEFSALAGSVSKINEKDSTITGTDSDMCKYISRSIEYRNKKQKWVSGTLLSVNAMNNTCIVQNNVNELVTVKLSTSVRLSEYKNPILPDNQWFARLKVGDRIECKYRWNYSFKWIQVMVMSIDLLGEMRCEIKPYAMEGIQEVVDYRRLRELL